MRDDEASDGVSHRTGGSPDICPWRRDMWLLDKLQCRPTKFVNLCEPEFGVKMTEIPKMQGQQDPKQARK
jgi:hypothetical protein